MTDKVQGIHVGAHKTGTSLVQRHLERFPETYAGHGLDFVTRDEMSRLVEHGGLRGGRAGILPGAVGLDGRLPR